MGLQGYEQVHANYLRENLPQRYRALKESGQLEAVCKRQAKKARDFEDAHRDRLNPGQMTELVYDLFLTPPIPSAE